MEVITLKGRSTLKVSVGAYDARCVGSIPVGGGGGLMFALSDLGVVVS